ncbi:glycosyltransferase, partial [Schaalia hyovaginalis]|uniref:glycosyltransferase family 2 protein n=1 Tax=Schaalia hyovaginalis TaxID=29316 RepID=UPI002A752812
MHSIDIMLPFWGEAAYLFDTVRAVLAQDSADWRLTVVDDCYPDPAVAEHFAALDDPRIVYIRNEQNLGITANYRRCLEMATA